MDKEKALLSLSNQIDIIKAHINRLKKSSYNIHPLDVDMLKKKTIEFYELVFELENPSEINEEVIIEDVVVEKGPSVEELVDEVKIEDEVVIEPKPEPVAIIEKTPIIEKDIEIEAPIKEVVVEEEQIEEQVEEVLEQEVNIIPEPDVEAMPKVIPLQEPEKPLVTKKQTTYDLFSASADGAIAERFKANEEPSFAEKMQKSHITNIREAIGINEKFLFINELFNGDMGRYNKILDDINELSTKKGVETYLFEMKIQFQWADNNEDYIKLKELLDRKFQ